MLEYWSSLLPLEPSEQALHLLMVEDSLLDAELMAVTLETAQIPFTYVIADQLSTCQQYLQQDSFDAVLTDYNLPGFTAYDTLKLLRQTEHEIPLILVTGTLGEEAAVDCIKAGMTDYVLKDRMFRLPMVLRRSLQEFALLRQQRLATLRIYQQAQREQLLNQISRTLNSSLDPNAVLETIVNLTGEVFGVDRVIIYELNDEYFRVLKEWRMGASVISLLGVQVPVSAWPQLLNPNSIFWCQRVMHAPDYLALDLPDTSYPVFRQTGTLSALRVPVFIHGHLFGGLSLQTTHQKRTFSDEEIALLERIAAVTAIALYNAQSYERLEEQVRERTRELEAEKLLSDAANRAKTEFLAHMSHELRTPMTGILGFANLLLKQAFGPLNEKQLQYVDGIITCGEHLLDLINDLLDLSKIEAGKEELYLEEIAVVEVCEACTSAIQEMAQARGLQLTFQIDPTVAVCIADKRRLLQILFNLLANAVKFTEIGSVRLEVMQQDGTLFFAVTDTGIGIAPHDQEKLFQSFQQLDSGLNRRYEGTGLGLTLARKLARLHGGDIRVTSEVGRGSCFTLVLPPQEALDLPDADRVVGTTANQDFAVAAEGDRINTVSVSGEGVDNGRG